MNTDIYSFDAMGLTENANNIKEAVLMAMERNGLLTKPAAEIARDYAVVLHKRGWLGRLFRRICGGEASEDTLAIEIVKKV